jgi:uncharacterized lipoprotein YehR (DUF1307 family)
MRKSFLLFVLAVFISATTVAQKAEVLYFKANLTCCQAKACYTLESDVKAVVEKNFPSSKVVFKEVKIADEANKELVEKYHAKSQTVVMVIKKRKKEKVVDLSAVVRQYARSSNKDDFEKEFVDRVKAGLR